MFESEIRRRVWWHFLGRDGRAGEDHGFQHLANPSLLSGAEMPLNLDDSDLYPEMTQLPPPRLGWTRLSMALVNIEVARTWSKLMQLADSPTHVADESVRAQVISELNQKAEEILQYCNPVVPQQRMTLRVARFVLRKIDVVTRQQWRAMRHSDEQELAATEESFTEAISVLEEADDMWTDELLRPFRWAMRAYPQYHLVLYILWYLCTKRGSPSALRAFNAVEGHLARVRLTEDAPIRGSKWPVLMALKSTAMRIVAESQENEPDGSNGDGVTTACGDGNTGIQPPGIIIQKDRGAVATDDMAGRADDPQVVLDWSTILQDFQLDGTDLSLIF